MLLCLEPQRGYAAGHGVIGQIGGGSVIHRIRVRGWSVRTGRATRRISGRHSPR